MTHPQLETVPPAFVATLRELTGLLIEDLSLERLLEQVLELTSRAISASSAVSVTVVGDSGDYLTLAASDADARAIDALQYELFEGPCIDAVRNGREHHLSDLRTAEHFPRFRERALKFGYRTLFAVPLTSNGVAIGALNLFATEPDALGEQDLWLARQIAAPAAATIANARAYRRVVQLTDQLQEALDSRAVIEQAKGVLMARLRCGPDEAFERLRDVSQRSNLKLRVVAEYLVDRAGRPDA